MDQEHTFESAMQRLEEIVKLLENPDVTLEEGMSLYKEGAQCSRFCREKLEAARHELEIWRNGSAEAASEENLGDN